MVPSIYDFKPAFQRLLRPLVRTLVEAGVTPNHLTLAAALGSIAVGVILGVTGQPRLLVLLPGWLLVRMALNAMDGIAAREHGMSTRLGRVLNEVGDVVSDIALYLPLARFGPQLLWPAVALALAATLTELCGLLGPVLGGPRRYEGPMGKSDRALVIGGLGLLGGLMPRTLAWWPPLLWVAVALALVTCWHRAARALRGPT